jgi:hypothetical protein
VRRDRASSQCGAVTAELAIALPLLVAVTLGLVWVLSLGSAQVRVVDAARETARALARGEVAAEAIDRGREIAPSGTLLTVTTDDDTVVVSGKVRIDGVAGLLESLPAVEVTARAVAAREQPP